MPSPYEVEGVRTTANIEQGIRLPDIRETVLELEPNAAPLTLLTTKLHDDSTHNPEFSWFEEERPPRFDLVNEAGGSTSGDTTITVDNGSYFAAGARVKVTRTGELMIVDAVAGNNLTVRRGVGSTAQAIIDNDELWIVGMGYAEGSLAPVARSTDPVKKTNYTEITRNSFHSTLTLIHSDTWVKPADWDRKARQAAREHRIDLENKRWLGMPSENLATTPGPERTTGGVDYWLQTNRTDVGGAMTEGEFFGAFNAGFRHGNRIKWGFVSRLFTQVVNEYPKGKLELVQDGPDAKFESYGIDVMRYRTPFGTVNLTTHNLFEGAKWGGRGVFLDMETIKDRPLANAQGSRRTHIVANIQAPGEDAKKSEYLDESGFELGQEKRSFLIDNVTG